MARIRTPDQDQQFMRGLSDGISDAMRLAAEPLIQKALQDIEKTMRARVAQICVGLVEGGIDIFREERRLIISIRDFEKELPREQNVKPG